MTSSSLRAWPPYRGAGFGTLATGSSLLTTPSAFVGYTIYQVLLQNPPAPSRQFDDCFVAYFEAKHQQKQQLSVAFSPTASSRVLPPKAALPACTGARFRCLAGLERQQHWSGVVDIPKIMPQELQRSHSMAAQCLLCSIAVIAELSGKRMRQFVAFWFDAAWR